MKTEIEISKILAGNLRRKGFTPYSDYSFFDDNILARRYADIFGIEPSRNWFEAYKIVTEGQGDELRKINTLVSSSLLSLLAFHKLFLNNTDLCLEAEIPGHGESVKFDKCLFEVRNTVIRLPSCVDVALYSTESNILLFLESKFTEIFSICEKTHYGKGYIDLYSAYLPNLFGGCLKVEQSKFKGKDRLLLETVGNRKRYIDGIKQSVSHLIGLVRGPYKGGQGYYPDEYYEMYGTLYDNACELFYGTILYEPKGLNEDNGLCNDYIDLYRNTIGEHGAEIVDGIREWDRRQNMSCDKAKRITVLNEPLTYQTLFKGTNNNLLLTSDIQSFYSL